MSGTHTIDDVEQGDKITFELPHGKFKGEEVSGGVGEVRTDNGEVVLNVKAGAYYRVTADNFVDIEAKGDL